MYPPVSESTTAGQRHQHPQVPVGRAGQQGGEADQERHVDGDQRGGRHIPPVPADPVGEPPDHRRQHGHDEAERERVGLTPPGQAGHQDPPATSGISGGLAPAVADGPHQLPDAHADREHDHAEEGRPPQEQRGEHGPDEHRPRRRSPPAGCARRVRSRAPLGGRRPGRHRGSRHPGSRHLGSRLRDSRHPGTRSGCRRRREGRRRRKDRPPARRRTRRTPTQAHGSPAGYASTGLGSGAYDSGAYAYVSPYGSAGGYGSAGTVGVRIGLVRLGRVRVGLVRLGLVRLGRRRSRGTDRRRTRGIRRRPRRGRRGGRSRPRLRLRLRRRPDLDRDFDGGGRAAASGTAAGGPGGCRPVRPYVAASQAGRAGGVGRPESRVRSSWSDSSR